MPTSVKGWLLLTGAAMIGLLIFATAYQYWLERGARSWRKASGRIRSSKVVARKVRKIGDKGSEMRNFPEVTYEYEVDGKIKRGSRIHLGHDVGNVDVAETMARYPEGAPVIVYYNPNNPTETALERDAPDGIYQTLVITIVCCIGMWLAFAFGTEPLVETIANSIPKPGNIWAVCIFGGAGLFMTLLALAATQEIRATKTWKSTWGRIESSEVERFKSLSPDRGRRRSLLFAPMIVYSYEVNRHRYTNSRLNFGGQTFLSWDFLARKKAAAFKAGASIEVFYDPTNPASAVLHRRSAGLRLVWTAAIVLLALAIRAAGLI